MNRRSQIYLFYGDDEFPLNAQAREIVDELLPGGEKTLALDSIDARAEKTESALLALKKCTEALQTQGFFGSRRVVWLRDATFFSEKRPAWAEEVKTQVSLFIAFLSQGLPDTHVLIITAPHVDGRSKLVKICGEKGTVKTFELPEKSYQIEKQAAAWIKEVFESRQCMMDADGVRRFYEKVGSDSRQIVNEAEKLMLWAGERKRFSVADVEAIVSSSRTALAWDLADAVGARHIPRALSLLRQLMYQKTAELFLLSLIEGRIGDMLLFREAEDRGWVKIITAHGGRDETRVMWQSLPDDVDAVLKKEVGKDPRALHPYRAALLARQAMAYSRKELEGARRLILATYEKILSSSTSSEQVMTLLLIRIMRRASLTPMSALR